jgi:hypothetical protein
VENRSSSGGHDDDVWIFLFQDSDAFIKVQNETNSNIFVVYKTKNEMSFLN